MEKKITAAILLLVLGGLWGCSGGTSGERRVGFSDEDEAANPVVMVVKKRSDTLSAETAGQILKALHYAKIPFKTVDLGLLNSNSDLMIPSSVRVLCVTTSDMESLKNREVERLVRFASEGNTILFTSPVWDGRFGFLQGMKKEAGYSTNKTAADFIFKKDIYPGFKNRTYKTATKQRHEGFSRSEFINNIEIIAGAENDPKYPAILRNKVGLGKVYLFNTSVMNDKIYRGLLFSTITSGLSGIPYPVANVSTIFLDDFPAPVYNQKMAPIAREYNITHAQFVTNVWWPEMKAFADTFNIDYSAMTAFNYNANVVPPFDFAEWRFGKAMIDGKRKEGSIWLARDVVRSRHELAFHGYNHFSLWMKDWSRKEFMITAVQAAKKRWVVDQLGQLPVTYVPPTNEVDSLGLVSVKTGMPSLKYMSSLYTGDIEEGGGREFGPDPYVPGLYDYPRVSSGFYNFDNSVFDQNGLYQLTGIWTHFIHPDDVFQVNQRDEDEFTSRNRLGLGWHKSTEYGYGLYEVFRKRLVDTKTNYPLIRFKAAKDAAPVSREWVNSGVEYSLNEGTVSYKHQLNGRSYVSASIDGKSYWFMYADSANYALLEKRIKPIADEYASTPYWEGSLIQFSTQEDSLILPNLAPGSRFEPQLVRAEQQSVMKRYRSYVAAADSQQDQYVDREEPDTRLEDALQALGEHPGSRTLQDGVIALSIEFERVELAINLLELRLLHEDEDQWSRKECEQLLTYYGWEGQTARAWGLLEKLWKQHKSNAVIALKDRAADVYGYPGEDVRNTWLNREITLNPSDEKALNTFVQLNQSEEKWPATKRYLKRLIAMRESSDTLYAYAVQQSLWYDEPKETLRWLEGFPENARSQLTPLAKEIAEMYAYTGGNYAKAFEWAGQATDFPPRTRLDWLLQQKRYKAFIDQSKEHMAENPQDDSLRTYVGEKLLYAGFYDKSYETLYPLFIEGRAAKSTAKLIQTEIGYKPYEEKKKLYWQYPAFFSDSLGKDLQQRYRLNEGVKAGFTGSYASDNFDHSIGRLGAFAEWGERTSYTHRIKIEETFLSSNVTGSSLSDRLLHARYLYVGNYREGSMQSRAGGGLYYFDGKIRPYAEAGLWLAKDSAFTSGLITMSPVFTHTALRRNINRIKGTGYREDYWWRGTIQSSFSLTGDYYTDNVLSFEMLGRGYFTLPFSTRSGKYRPVAELSYSDATESFTSGIPYYTPDNLFIKGLGFEFDYAGILKKTLLKINAELLAKHDNRDGFFITTSAHLKTTIKTYWELSLTAELSSSRVYRYNNVGLTLSYIFPRKPED